MGILTQYSTDIGGIDDSLIAKIGNSSLTTTAQDLSGAINEHQTSILNIISTIGNDSLTTTAQYLTGAINELNSNKVNKSGDTMTGTLNFTNTNGIGYTGSQATYPIIKFIDNTVDVNGNGISIGGGGLVIVGAGESSDGIAATHTSGGDEVLELASDGAINIWTNVQNGATSSDVKKSIFATDGSFTPAGQIKTSFKNSIAMGSYQATATTIDGLCTELRYSSGCAGSVSIGTAYTKDGVSIPTGWYNFIWSPHRSGGINGQANSDNTNYGSLWLSGMTVSGCYMIRFASSAIAQVREIYHSMGTWLANIGSGSADHKTALKSWFDSNKASTPRNRCLGFYSAANGNGSIYTGYFLNGYDSNPYGGFYVAHYNTPYYVGIQNGTYTQYQLATHNDLAGMVKSISGNASGLTVVNQDQSSYYVNLQPVSNTTGSVNTTGASGGDCVCYKIGKLAIAFGYFDAKSASNQPCINLPSGYYPVRTLTSVAQHDSNKCAYIEINSNGKIYNKQALSGRHRYYVAYITA